MLFTNRDLRKLIIPLVIEQILAVFVGLADTIMIAAAGEAAVSGVSLVDTVNVLVINIFSALATGGAVVAGHCLGQKDNENASKSAWQMILVSSVFSIVITALFIGAHDFILRTVFGQIEADVMASAKIYLIITALSIFPLAIYNACAALFRAMGNSKVTMWISLIMNLLNFAGNAFLIFVMKWGVAGAAISTTFSRLVAAVIIFVMMFHAKRAITFKGQVTWKMDFVLVKKILYIGIPNGLENSMFQLGKILLLSLVSTFGTYAIAANAVCNTVAMINILPGLAINLAILSVTSVCVGAGDYQQARYYTKKLSILMNICMVVLSFILIIGTPFIVKLYQLSDQTAELATQVIRYHAVMAMFIWIPSFSISNTLRAAGDVMWTMVVAVISMWIFRIGAAYILSGYFDMGLMGVWIAMTVDWIFRAICYMTRYKGKKWEQMLGKKSTE
ncbi:MAG: MATE family efflux transporter [Lachnospiraceae bacterium]|nr:MATE family efflux transporter [Lachnospiraceae bacterium]